MVKYSANGTECNDTYTEPIAYHVINTNGNISTI